MTTYVFKDNPKILNGILILFGIILPFIPILAPIMLGVLIFTFLIFGNINSFDKLFQNNKNVIIIIVYGIFVCLGMLYTPHLGVNYSRIAVQLPLIVIPLLLMLLNLNIETIIKVKKSFVIACIIFSIYAFFTLIYNLVINFEHRNDYNFVQRSMHHFHYPYDVLYLNAAFVFLLFLEFNIKLKILGSICFFLFIVLSGTRIGLFNFLLIFIVYVVINYKLLFNRKSFIFFILLFSCGFFLINSNKYVSDKFYDTLSKIGFSTEESVSVIGEEYHKISLRENLWDIGYKVFTNKKLLGYGPKGSREELNKAYIESGHPELVNFNSHNQYLTTALNHGLIGFILLVLIFIISGYLAIKTRNFSSFLLLLVMLISFLTESMLERQKGVFFFGFFISLILIESGRCRDREVLVE